TRSGRPGRRPAMGPPTASCHSAAPLSLTGPTYPTALTAPSSGHPRPGMAVTASRPCPDRSPADRAADRVGPPPPHGGAADTPGGYAHRSAAYAQVRALVSPRKGRGRGLLVRV